MWSRPTFWPRACFALAPHTIALNENELLHKYQDKRRLTISSVSRFLYESHYRNLQLSICHVAVRQAVYNRVLVRAVLCIHARGRGSPTSSGSARLHWAIPAKENRTAGGNFVAEGLQASWIRGEEGFKTDRRTGGRAPLLRLRRSMRVRRWMMYYFDNQTRIYLIQNCTGCTKVVYNMR